MVKKNIIGSWAFLIGVIIAFIIGLFMPNASIWWTIALMAIGIIVGLLNIADEEVQPFLMSGAVLIIASSFGQDITQNITVAFNMLGALLSIFVPATIIVAIKNVFSLAKH
jgi:hypothetical protein